MLTNPVTLAIFELCVAMFGSVTASLGALYYLRRVRIERPAVGTFNGRDIAVLFVLLGTIPLFYLLLPRWLLTSFLAITFMASLSIGFKPVVPAGWLWLGIGGLLGADIWLARTMLGTVAGWQLQWAVNSVVVLLGAICVANLYVQGGMKLKHVAWFSLVLALYDNVFTAVVPVTNKLVEEFLGYPLDPSMGMRRGFDNASIGLGDLLVYALFMIAAYKAYGRRAGWFAFSLIIVFGAALPALAPLLINYVDSRTDVLVPAQLWFGPAAFLGYLWLKRHYGTERTMREFLASGDVVAPRQPVGVAAPAAVAPAEPQVQTAPAPLEPVASPSR